jgi:hypothetical protein
MFDTFDDHEEAESRLQEIEPVRVSYHTRGRETDKAQFFKTEPGFSSKGVWIPKSLLSDVTDRTFCVPKWFADKEELDYEE